MGAKDDLIQLVQRGFSIDLRQHGPAEPDFVAPVRQSAVLILFGPASLPIPREPGRQPGDLRPTELDILLTRRSDQMRHHPGQVAFPGGGMEPRDLTPEATALRETAEETGIDTTAVDILGTLPEVYLPVSNNLVSPVIGWWDHPGSIAVDTREAVEAFRAPVAQLLDPSARRTSILTVRGTVYRGPAFQYNNGHEKIVWGFTGRLLDAIFDRAGWTVPWDETREISVGNR